MALNSGLTSNNTFSPTVTGSKLPSPCRTYTSPKDPRRYASPIPARHFKMARYYGFMANRKCGILLPKVNQALSMTPCEKWQPPRFAVLMKAFLEARPELVHPVCKSVSLCWQSIMPANCCTAGCIGWKKTKA